MQYMALIYSDESKWDALSDEDRSAAYDRYRSLVRDAETAGVLAGGHELSHTRDATTVRVRSDETLVTDGPYAEVKEALGGYFLFECASMDDALELGRAHPRRRARRRRGATGLRRPGGGPAVKYAVLIYGDDSTWVDLPDEEKAQLRADEMPAWVTLFEELGKADPNVTGKELDGRDTARVVQVRDGERLVTDGPFAETKEILGGVFLMDLPDLDEAIRVAALIPTAKHGSIEIRPVLQ